MDSADKAIVFCAAVAFALGTYLGVFLGEANAMFECEKSRTMTVSGYFWKGIIKYACVRAQAAPHPTVTGEKEGGSDA